MLNSTTYPGGKHGKKETDHEKDQRSPAAEMGAWSERPAGWRQSEDPPQHGAGICKTRRTGRVELAAAKRIGRS